MSFRPRDSNIFRAGAAPPRGSTIGSSQPQLTTSKKSKPAEDEDDSILLKDDEIVSCLALIINMHFTLGDLKNPSPTQVQLVYEQLVDEVMGVRRETVEALLSVGMREMEHPETHRESMSLMAFYRSLSRLMAVCDVRDFSFQDLLKPEYKRLRVHLSQIINFMRFRGDASRAGLISEQVARPEEAKARLEELLLENEHLRNEILRVEEQVKRDEPAIKIAKEGNEALTSDLRAMKKRQTGLSVEYDKERNDRHSLKSALTDRQYLTVKGKQECDKIRPYIVDSPEKLQQVIVDMNATLLSEKNLSDTLERRIRALQTSTESFTIVEADVTSCIKIMEECEGWLVKMEEMARKVSRHEEVLKSRENENKDVERQEALLTRQLEHLRERIDRVRSQAEGKREQAQKRMEELKGVYDELSRERGEKSKEMERKKMKIEQIEKKMADLKEKTEDEVHRAHVEMAKMKAHIETYIREMEQRINSLS
ncbi:Nuf2 family-domain-containing protein [Tirmania nivea]|nr:Nuf2 family-domain-containing protein [Tirmania nivea]